MDQSKSRKYQELPDGFEPSMESEKSKPNTVNLETNVAHIFDESHGFTACMVVEGVTKELVLKILGDPEAYMRLSPNIVCVTFVDVSDSEKERKLHLDLTMLRSIWWLWERAESVEGYFVVDTENGEVTVRNSIIHNNRKVEVTCFYQIDSHDRGVQIVATVSVDKPLLDSCDSCHKFFPCWISGMNTLKHEQRRFLNNLRDHVQTDSSLETYRKQVSSEYLMSATL